MRITTNHGIFALKQTFIHCSTQTNLYYQPCQNATNTPKLCFKMFYVVCTSRTIYYNNNNYKQV